MLFDERYKGYRIKYRQTAGYSALIWPPNSGLLLTHIPQATRDEGMEVLKQRTYAYIDADIAEYSDYLAKKGEKSD